MNLSQFHQIIGVLISEGRNDLVRIIANPMITSTWFREKGYRAKENRKIVEQMGSKRKMRHLNQWEINPMVEKLRKMFGLGHKITHHSSLEHKWGNNASIVIHEEGDGTLIALPALFERLGEK